MFGIEDKLVVSNGRRDARAAAADGPIRLSFEAKLEKPGWYCFTFIRVDEADRVYQVNTVRVLVTGRDKSTKPIDITPAAPTHNQYLSAAPDTLARVGWGYNPGGEGRPGGWRLMRTGYYEDSKPRPSVPGFEKSTGE